MWDLLPRMEPHVFKVYTDEYPPSKIRELCIIPSWNGFPEEQKLVFTLHYDYNVMKGLQSRKEARIKCGNLVPMKTNIWGDFLKSCTQLFPTRYRHTLVCLCGSLSRKGCENS